MNDKKHIGFVWAGFATCLAAALLLPRIAARGSEGLAAGATAALVFLVFFGMACGAAIYLVLLVVRRRSRWSVAMRTAGIVPIGICILCIAGFFLLMRLKNAPPETPTTQPPVTSIPASAK